jgi:hypothetical protein
MEFVDLATGDCLLSLMVALYASWMDRLRMVENCISVGTFDGLSERCLVELLDGGIVVITDVH